MYKSELRAKGRKQTGNQTTTKTVINVIVHEIIIIQDNFVKNSICCSNQLNTVTMDNILEFVSSDIKLDFLH